MAEVTDMTDESVPPPPGVVAPSSPHGVKWLVAAVPFVTVGWLVLAAVLVAATLRIERWELAPGEAMEVGGRISFDKSSDTKNTAPSGSVPKRHPAENSIRFVTAFGGQLSALDAVIGWLDPNVRVDTYEEHFGTRTPETNQKIGFQSMFSAKQIAEFVAMKRLGLDATFTEGPVTVSELVCEDVPAAGSACRLLDAGDTIVSFDGEEVATLTDLAREMEGRKAGESVDLEVVPDGKEPDDKSARQKRTVTLMTHPEEAGRAIIGIVPADTRTVTLPFEVGISTPDIGGPSAGLAFTLALLDELTEGNLTGRGRVVATGTMSEKEEVGAIGALRQKAVAARDAGATLFLVPAGQSDEEVAEARAAAGPRLKVVKVATLNDALVALRANGGDPLPAP
jgi:PDZ domain-containing protein